MARDKVTHVYVYAVELDDQGYDEHGSYYGIGRPVYLVEPYIGRSAWGLSYAKRADDDDEIREHVACNFPNAEIEE